MKRSVEALELGKMEEVDEGTGGEWGILVQKSGYGSIKKPLLTRKKELQILGVQEGGLQQVLKGYGENSTEKLSGEAKKSKAASAYSKSRLQKQQSIYQFMKQHILGCACSISSVARFLYYF